MAYRHSIILMIAGGLLGLAGLVLFLLAPEPRTVQVDTVLTEYGVETSVQTVFKGDLVQLNIRNAGRIVHELEVEGYGVEVEDIAPGEVRTLTFRVREAGAIELVCHLPGHAEAGMRTTLRVIG